MDSQADPEGEPPSFSSTDKLVGYEGTKRKRENRWPPVGAGKRFKCKFVHDTGWSVELPMEVLLLLPGVIECAVR
jgi:hypothetical protein